MRGRAELVGRERELGTLLSALESAQGGLFLVGGEPGIGKTRLAVELADRARARGATVAWGAAWDGGGAPAYWPWIQVLRALRSVVPAPDERLRRDLGPLWEGEATPAEGDPELLRFRRFDALRAVLAAAAAHAPLVVILDDLHAADAGSLLALTLVVQALRGLPVLVVATHREDEGSLGKLLRLGTSLHLGRLGRDDVARLMSDLEPISAALVDAVHETSAGNPLFVEETVRLVRSGARPDRAPEGVRAVIRERLARLDGPVRAVLEAASILGIQIPRGPLAALVGLAPAELDRRIGALARAGILEELGDATVRFGHALFRTVLHDELTPERRGALHLAAAAVVTDAEAVAGHLLAAPGADPARVVEAATRAAELTFRAQAFDRSVELLEGALARLADDGRRIDVELQLAEALVRTGAGDRARRLARAAAASARAAGDATRLARAALAYGAELRPAVIDPVLIGLLEEALAALGGADRGLEARVRARLAAARQPADDPSGPIAEANRAVAGARALGDDDTLLAVLFAAGSAQAAYAPPVERAAVSRELAALALRRGDLVLAQHGYTRLAVDCADLGDLAGMELAVRAQERLGSALGHARWRWRGALLRSMLALARGDWDQAGRAETDAAAFVAEAEDPGATLALLIHRFGSLRARGATIEQIVGLAMNAPRDAGGEPVMRELTLASIRARLGDLAGARQGLDATPSWPPQFHRSPATPALLADIAIRLGDPRLAAAALADLERLAPEWPAVSWQIFGFIWDGPVARWIGGCLAVLERWDEAAAALEEALALAEAAGARPFAEEIARDLAAVRQRLGAAPSPTFTLVRDGDVWTVTSAGRVAHLKHTRGLEILAELVAQPGREIHVLDLGARDPDAVVDAGDAGELLDAAAKQAYRRRIAEIEEELAQAEGWNDVGRKERARAELELLRDEIARGVGLGGRDRRAAAAVERARVNVQKRLRAAIKKISEGLPDLARHLEIHVKTGIYVTYRSGAPPM